ncbi:KRAB-A domain-containing protein 2-like [Chrysoperla carnea]|uniref:KRAB-A domain-containing protein 2-like n=1 Tax=Chrysoperla carnea TaxID=189513 RepID=UPI001D081D82|nr:KRAB-A domain-containing protein 2-like [Chrysoperla carnea]
MRRTAMDYYWMNKYDIMTIANEDCLIFKRLTANAPPIRILPREQYFHILSNIHLSCGHGGRDKILYHIKKRYYIPKKAVEIFVSLCPVCKIKRNVSRKVIVTKPINSRNFNLSGKVDLIDFESCPDGEFKWLLSYQDNATKFLNLRPLKTKREVEVASELMKIFLTFGVPCTLQSDNGRKFTANIIKELVIMWPECKIVHGNPRGLQTQGSHERSNQDIENNLRAWMNENNSTNWSLGCFFIQYFKNTSLDRTIKRSPYKALFGSEPKAGLNESDIPTSTPLRIDTEVELKTEATNSDASFDRIIGRSPYKTLFGSESKAGLNGSDIPTSTPSMIETEMELKTEATNSDDNNDNIENLESNFTCAVCHNDLTDADHKCEYCNSVAMQYEIEVTNYDDNNDNIENLEANFTCAVCHNDVTGAHKCEYCNSVVTQYEIEVTHCDENNDNIENLESNFTCAVCHNDVTGAHKCEFCNSVVMQYAE